MNYIRQINAFWEMQSFKPISAAETRLYFAILNFANRSGWRAGLRLPNSTLIGAGAASNRHSLNRMRAHLAELGYIAYAPSKSMKECGVYTITQLYNEEGFLNPELFEDYSDDAAECEENIIEETPDVICEEAPAEIHEEIPAENEETACQLDIDARRYAAAKSGEYEDDELCSFGEREYGRAQPMQSQSVHNAALPQTNTQTASFGERKYRQPQAVSVYVPKKAGAPKKRKYLDDVYLTDEEYKKLTDEYGADTEGILELLNNYKCSSGKKYQSDYFAVRSWAGERYLERKRTTAAAEFGESELYSVSPNAALLDKAMIEKWNT